jgi:SAM-dependent methyltransferase
MQSGGALLKASVPLIQGGQYLTALDSLRQELTLIRAGFSSDEWRTFVAQDFARREYSRYPLARLLKSGLPGRGALHDPRALDVIYGLGGFSTAASNALLAWEIDLGFCVSLRARRNLLARELSDLALTTRHPRVLAVGCGHLREAASALSSPGMQGGEFVAFEHERTCLDLIRSEFKYPGLRTLLGSWRDAVENELIPGKFDLIYLPTLFDTLEDSCVRALLSSVIPLLGPGGRLMAANFCPDLKDAAYLEACLDWWPRYRSEQELAAVVSQLSVPRLRGQAIFREDSGGSAVLYLEAA